MATTTDIDSVIRRIDTDKKESGQKPQMQIQTSRDLLEESTNIGDLKRYNMMLQNISLSQNVKNYLNNNRQN